jgi:uncharacterized protein (TIGR02145 family)
MKTTSFLSLAAMLCVLLLLSCSSGVESPPSPSKYCIYSETRECFPTSQSTCPVGGELSDFCPYSGSSVVNSSSSSEVVHSSSSSSAGGSSSLSVASVSSSSSVKSSSSSSVGGGSSSSATSVGSLSSSSVATNSQASSSSFAPSSSSVILSSSNSKPSSSSVLSLDTIPRPPSSSSVNKCSDIANCRTVQIGDQVWMAENFNYKVTGSKCNDDREYNCDKYGRLYKWSTAMALPSSCDDSNCTSRISEKHRGICPSGWHIPSDAEWTTLMDFVGGSSTAGMYLKAKSGWNNYGDYTSGNGYDTYGFAALPGGYCGFMCRRVGDYGSWWSSSEYEGSVNVYLWAMSNGGANAYYGNHSKLEYLSVRCVKD